MVYDSTKEESSVISKNKVSLSCLFPIIEIPIEGFFTSIKLCEIIVDSSSDKSVRIVLLVTLSLFAISDVVSGSTDSNRICIICFLRSVIFIEEI